MFEKGMSDWIECDYNGEPKRMIPFGELYVSFLYKNEYLFAENIDYPNEVISSVQKRLPLFMLANKKPPIIIQVSDIVDEDELNIVLSSKKLNIEDIYKIGNIVALDNMSDA